LEANESLYDDPKYQLVDVNFAEKDMMTTRILYDLDSCLSSIKLQQKRNQVNGDADSKDKKLQKMQTKYDKLKEKYFEISSSKGNLMNADKNKSTSSKPDYKENERQFIYAFTTLRSMDGLSLLQKAYDEFKSPCFRCCIKFCGFSGCCCQKNKRRLKMREIYGTYPTSEIAILPDNINW